MKVIVWNIRQGGGARIPRIVEELSARDADVIALTEFRAGISEPLAAALREAGWPHMATSEPREKENGIAVFSTTPLGQVAAHGYRWLDVQLPEYGFGLCVLHIMAATNPSTGATKHRMWNEIVRAAEARRTEPWLFAGSWNTGAHRADEKGKTFDCAEQFGRLSELGWIDLWRRSHPGQTEWTWYSNHGNGFRLDHAFASPALAPRVRYCRYSHVERAAKVSDHSLTVVEVL